MTIKYIFCINCGRSGSKYLTTLFKHVEGVEAHHEPDPIGNKNAMREYWNGNTGLMSSITKQKCENIKKLTINGKIYVETNHCFIKGFGWYLPEHINQNEIGVIILRRTKHEIVNSLYRINCTPFSEIGNDWILIPRKNNLTPSPISYVGMQFTLFCYKVLNRTRHISKVDVKKLFKNSSFKLLNWYVDETESLCALYQQLFPNVTYVNIDLTELNTEHGFQKIIDRFELNVATGAKLTNVIGRKTNEKLKKNP